MNAETYVPPSIEETVCKNPRGFSRGECQKAFEELNLKYDISSFMRSLVDFSSSRINILII